MTNITRRDKYYGYITTNPNADMDFDPSHMVRKTARQWIKEMDETRHSVGQFVSIFTAFFDDNGNHIPYGLDFTRELASGEIDSLQDWIG